MRANKANTIPNAIIDFLPAKTTEHDFGQIIFHLYQNTPSDYHLNGGICSQDLWGGFTNLFELDHRWKKKVRETEQ